MNDKVYKRLLQALLLICLTIMACRGVLNEQSISVLFGTIVGYVYAVSKEAYIKNNDNNDNNKNK